MTKLLAPQLRPRPFRKRDLARMVEALADWAASQRRDRPPHPH